MRRAFFHLINCTKHVGYTTGRVDLGSPFTIQREETYETTDYSASATVD